MLTRLKLKRGEGHLTRERDNPQSRKAGEPSPPPSFSPSRVSAEVSKMSEHEGEIPTEIDPREEERVFRKAFLDLTEMVRILYQEEMRNWLEKGPNIHMKERALQEVRRMMIIPRNDMEVMVIHHPHLHLLPLHPRPLLFISIDPLEKVLF